MKTMVALRPGRESALTTSSKNNLNSAL